MGGEGWCWEGVEVEEVLGEGCQGGGLSDACMLLFRFEVCCCLV
jgi:hypothetical protein